MHRTFRRIPILAAGALLAAAACATAACAAPPSRAAALPAAPIPAVTATATATPSATPSPAPATTPSATLTGSMTGPGTYVQVIKSDSVAVYVLRPGATKWTLVSQAPAAVLPHGLPNYVLAPSGRLASTWANNRLSVVPANSATARVVATATAGGQVCLARWNGASNRLLYAVSTKDWKHATLYTVGADGTGRRALTGAADPGICRATWSPGGTTTAYVKNYALHLPIAEYHEAIVVRGGRTFEAHLHLSSKVHLESVLAIAPDGRHALVGTKTVQPDGSCGDGGPDGFAVVDLISGSAFPVTLHGPGYPSPELALAFDTAGHLVADTETSTETSASEFLQLFDYRGHYLRTLPKIVIAGKVTFSILAVVA